MKLINLILFLLPLTGFGQVDKIVTTRRYKLYIINEYGQKEYLSMELTKQK